MSGKKFADALKKFDRDQFYTPTEALALVKTMASAKFDESIDIAMFSCTSHALREALLAARARGLNIRIVFDRFQYRNLGDMAWFVQNGFDVRLGEGKVGPSGHPGSMHNKFVLFDGKLLEAGSYNWTTNAKFNNFENAQFFDDPSRVAAYKAYYERIFALSRQATSDDLRVVPAAG